jgi:hypothetical protein
MSALIEGMLAQVAEKSDGDSVSIRVADLKLVCSQAKARAQMIAIYEELLSHAAESITAGKPNLDLANVILRALATR